MKEMWRNREDCKIAVILIEKRGTIKLSNKF